MLSLAFLFAACGVARLPAPLHARIDSLVAAGHPDYAKHAAPLAADAEFLRRATLDLNGTVPTTAEVREFLADSDPKKRMRAIDRLLAAPAFARRMAWHFDVTLMERRRDAKVPRAAWEDFLRASFAANTPYDEFVRGILSADGSDPKTRPAAKFLLDRDLEPNVVTRDLSRVFLGRNIQCAQCHDHPIIDDYKQADYYGILAFTNRSFLFPNATAPTAVIAEKGEGDATFVSVFDKDKKQGTALPKVPGGKAVMEPKFEKGKEYKVPPAKDVKPVPAFSRREQLAANITTNPAFARTAANRLWAMMHGRGLVNPIDLDHEGNPPSHPELLDLLAKELKEHRFDVKWFVREIALSKSYQLSSETPAGIPEGQEDRYLAAQLKPLSPEQLASAAAQATGGTDGALLPKFRALFGAQPGQPEDFAASLDQTLFLKFNPQVRTMLAPQKGNLAERLTKLTEPGAFADELFVSVFSRPPTDDEKKDVAAALAAAKDRNAVVGDLIWALLASAEFRFNH